MDADFDCAFSKKKWVKLIFCPIFKISQKLLGESNVLFP